MSKSNKNPPKKPDSDEEEGRPSSSARRDGERKKKESKDKKKCHKRLNEKERILLNNMTETVEKLLEGDCKRKRHRRRRRSPSSEDTGLGGEIRTTGMEVESSSEFEDPRPGRSRDPPRRQECRRRRRHQRRPAERPNDSSSSPCSPQQQQQQRKPRRCAQNERPDATLILRKSPVKEQCVSNRNEADSAAGGRPEIQRLRMQLIAKVRKKKPNVQEQVKRVIRMMKLDELEKVDKKTRDQKEFTKAQCNQFQRMYDKWQHSIKPKKFVSRSIKGPVADYWDRRHEERAQAAQASSPSLFEQALRVAAAWAAAAPLVDPSGGYSPIKESSGEWRTPPRPQVRTRRRGDPGVRRRIEFSSESEDSDDGESRPRARPPRHRRRPRCKDGDDGLLDE